LLRYKLIDERWRWEMIEFLKFVGGVVVSAGILATTFAFILQSVARFGGGKPAPVTATSERSGPGRRVRASKETRKALARVVASKRSSATAAIL
jgi:hypothetical protein